MTVHDANPALKTPRKPKEKPADAVPQANWRMLNGEWMFRAKDINEGDEVEVGRRDGTTTIETVGEIVQEDSAGWRFARPT